MDEPRNPSEQPLPGSVSNQNSEEAEPGHDGQQETRRPPEKRGGDNPGGDDESGGEASEGTQSTGDPRSAG
jgi:hypothetical protein